MSGRDGKEAPNERLVEKLRKVLALTTSSIEGEAQAAAAHLQRLLTQHNLSIADLEQKGGQPAPGVHEQRHDLGKAAFTWKLDLADSIAEFYYCYPLVNRSTKTVAFIGRPDNVEALQMLYAWLIDQIRRIATAERRKHFDETGEHIDPLRWQVRFGVGCVERLHERLTEMRARQEEDEATVNGGAECTALAIHHKSEISDYLEKKFGRRVDGRETQRGREYRAKREAEDVRLAALKEADIEAYYRECPWDRPETEEQKAEREKRDADYWKKQEAKERKNARKRDSYVPRGGYRVKQTDWRKEEQGATAQGAGRRSADKVNLTPFVAGGKAPKGEIR